MCVSQEQEKLGGGTKECFSHMPILQMGMATWSTQSLGTHAKAQVPSSSSQDGPELLDKDMCTTRSSGQLLPNELDLPVAHTPVSQPPVSRCRAFSLLYPQASRIAPGTRRHGHMH